MEVLSLCPFRAGAIAWQSAPNAWSLTVVVKATFTIVSGGEATVASVQTPVVAFAGDSETTVEDLSPLKPHVDVIVLRGLNEDTASVEVASCVLPARGPVPPYAPARRLMLRETGLEWAAAVLRGEAASAGPVPDGFDFGFFQLAPRDQRIDLLRTGSPLVLNHVLPNQTRVETILPQRKPQAFRIHPQTGKASEIILRCDTLCVDAARSLLVLTFRGISDVDEACQANVGTIVVAAHSGGKKIRADRVERFLRNGEPIEGESNDGRHPLERRYDTVLAAPKGDTIALPEMESVPSGVWQATPAAHGESSIMRAGGGLPFQSASSETSPAPVPPAPLNAPVGGRRHATLMPAVEAMRSVDMPFHGLPPSVAEEHLPPLPPEGIFPPPPALLAIAPSPEPAAPIRPPAMLGSSFAQDEKTADFPPGHQQPEASAGGQTDKMPALVVPGVARSEMQKPAAVDTPQRVLTASSLAGKPAPTESKLPTASPNVVKSPGAILAAAKASKPMVVAPASPIAPKPTISTTTKPAASAVAPKPVALTVAPKPVAPKGPLKVPAPFGPKLKTEAPLKSNIPPPTAEKKPLAASPAKPGPVTADNPVVPAKPAPVPMRSQAPTILFPGMIPPGAVASTAMADAAKDAAVEFQEPFNAADALKLDECAALDAELRHRAANRKALLEKNKLSEKQWTAVHKHWSETIARETEVGERTLLAAYDAAYVTTQEKLGIDVGINTHAKLQIASERGTSATVLGELGLEPADQMRIGRVWTQRLCDEPTRMRELAAAIEKARAT